MVDLVSESWLQRLRAWRRRNDFRKAGVVLIHVPRTAGTSLALELYGRFVGHFSLADLCAVSAPDVLALPRFAIVLNPWDRLVSAWAFAKAGGGSGGEGAGRVTIHHGEQYQVPEFDTFERFVTEWLAVRELAALDGVFRPQIGYLRLADGTMPLQHLGRIEQIADTERWLGEVLGRPVALGRANSSERDDYRSYYTPALRDQVAQIYADDIAALGYDF